jgi:predicted adenine nucleotide alpha hydrolase (AANH) superfamily ATPase
LQRGQKIGGVKGNERMRLLLHVCCAPDLTHPFTLLREDYSVSAFFYNPNIHPEEEYYKRIGETRKLSKLWGIPLLEGEYNAEDWFNITAQYKNEPEGGKRCELCFKFRLEKTAQLAKEKGYSIFCTTLTISPHKNSNIINRLGKEIGEKYGIHYLESDFKKKDGFKKSVEISKKLGLYRQKYCGCIYSMK